jgi:hypothetical protein
MIGKTELVEVIKPGGGALVGGKQGADIRDLMIESVERRFGPAGRSPPQHEAVG